MRRIMPREEGERVDGQVLEVLGEPPAAPEPRERPLHDPALGQGHEALGRVARDYPEPPAAGPGDRDRTKAPPARITPTNGNGRRAARGTGRTPSRSCTSAGWITAVSGRPSVSIGTCRFLPSTFSPASRPLGSTRARLLRRPRRPGC